MNIVILEDDLSLNNTMVMVLELYKHKVSSYNNGKELLENLCENVDLYLLDINVPHINGLEVAKIIHQKNSQAQIIMVSADQSLSSLKDAYRYGCLDFIKKPFHIEELLIKLERVNLPTKDEDIYSYQGIQLLVESNSLTKNEKTFIDLLIKNRTHIVTYDAIHSTVFNWEYATGSSSNALRSLVRRLRLKMKDDIIQTISSQGYLIK